MKISDRIKKIVTFVVLLIIVVFNIYIYRNEFKVLSDPNDNIFQYALVDEAKNIWKNVFSGKLSPFYLLDSWNERWAEGFSLSLYYSHLPQAIISLVGFLVPIPTFKLFVIVRTLTLVTLPVMFFLGGTILHLPWGFNLILAFLSQVIFTDGLYGIDSSNYLWRGWGLSSQLFALFFLPLAFAYSIDYLENKKNLGKAIIFNFMVAQAHFGMYYLLLFAFPILTFFHLDKFKETVKRTAFFIFLTVAALSYFILPFFLLGQYKNFSYWDPIWKFNSWGMKQILIWGGNGNLFDFNRFPWLTLFITFGLFYALVSKKKIFNYLAVLLGFYFMLFAGRTTFGKLIDLIPGFSEYHLHRVIVMVQFVGIFIGAWFACGIIIKLADGSAKILSRGSKNFASPSLNKAKIPIVSLITILIIVVPSIFVIIQLEKPVVKYAQENNEMIKGDIKAYQQDFSSYDKIRTMLASMPRARVYAGRPGNWGRNFKVGETQVYMALSRDGFPVVGFLPESWSPNSDPEQFFEEENLDFYRLYNADYIVMPSDRVAPKFAKLVEKEGKYALYEVASDGWFTLGRSSFLVKSKKTDLLNITRLWFASSLFKTNEYPTIGLNNRLITRSREIRMLDLNNYDGGNIWQANPFNNNVAQTPILDWKKEQEEILVNGYKVKFEVKDNCSDCLLILRQSFHPNWQVAVNGKKIQALPVFPFYVGVPVTKKGIYEVTAIYKPDRLKVWLVYLEIFLISLIFLRLLYKTKY